MFHRDGLFYWQDRNEVRKGLNMFSPFNVNDEVELTIKGTIKRHGSPDHVCVEINGHAALLRLDMIDSLRVTQRYDPFRDTEIGAVRWGRHGDYFFVKVAEDNWICYDTDGKCHGFRADRDARMLLETRPEKK